MLQPGSVDFPGTLGVVGSLCVGEEGLLAFEVMEPGLDVSRPRRLVALWPAELLQNLIFAILRHTIKIIKQHLSATAEHSWIAPWPFLSL